MKAEMSYKTQFDYTVNGLKKSETVNTNSVFEYNTVVERLLPIADINSLHATSLEP